MKRFKENLSMMAPVLVGVTFLVGYLLILRFEDVLLIVVYPVVWMFVFMGVLIMRDFPNEIGDSSSDILIKESKLFAGVSLFLLVLILILRKRLYYGHLIVLGCIMVLTLISLVIMQRELKKRGIKDA